MFNKTLLLLGVVMPAALFTQATAEAWNYKQHGSDWTGLCKKESMQSPIAIPEVTIDIFYDYNVYINQGKTDDAYIGYGPHFISVHYETDGYISMNGSVGGGPSTVDKRFCALGSFEIHTPSEHTFKDAHYDVEIEILHIDLEGQEARVSIFFDRVAGGNTASPLFTALNIAPASEPIVIQPAKSLPLQEILESVVSGKNLFQYEGSLAYPPCTENVNWFVYNSPQPISDSQLSAL
jgi:carbonic anhydrase